jgi:hypothetical protein
MVFTVEGVIYKSTKELAIAELDLLSAAISAGKQALALYTDRVIYVVTRDFRVDQDPDGTGAWIPWSAQFVAEDPFWYATSETTDSVLDGVHQDLGIGDTNKTVTSAAGNALTYPRISMVSNGNITKIIAYNGNTSVEEWWKVTGLTIPVNSHLVVDHAAKTVTVDGWNCLGYFTGSFWGLKCGAANALLFKLTGASSTCAFYYTNRYY